MKPKIIYTKEFYCDDDHPIVYYVVDENNKGMCEYWGAKFIYEEKDFYNKMQEEKALLDMSMKESKKQKDERTPSEKLQDEIEPIPSYPCPMHEDYDEVDYKVADYYDEINDVEKMRRKKWVEEKKKY